MADLYWGVSDALDLYGEYLHVLKSKGIDLYKITAQENSASEAKLETEDVENNETNDGSKKDEKVLVDEPEDNSKQEEKIRLDVPVNDEQENAETGLKNKSDPAVDFNNENAAQLQANINEKIVSEKAAEQGVESENEHTASINTSINETIIPEKVAEQAVEVKIENIAPINDNIHETAVTVPEENESQNDSSTENSEIGAGDAPVCISNEEKRQQAGEDVRLNLEANPEVNFNSTLEQNCVNDDGEFEVTTEELQENNKPPIVNILIYGGGDPRHVIKTMAKRYSHLKDEGNACNAPILKFFLIDGCIEIIARNIVLLGIALERPELISLRNKVHLFMDVYGNALLRPICHQYLVIKSATLLKMVSDKSVLERMAPFINLDNLKYRERDGLQDAFEFWSPKPGYDFKIKEYWMARLRRLLTVRYDCRDGVFDWDLNMSLKCRGAQQICSQEYKYWRETGIAFTFPEYEQSKPNKTLAAGLVRNGRRYLHRGYIGDIQTGPFCTFGLRSAEERLHNSAHGENDYRATEVTERNLMEYFYELQNGSPYVHNAEISHKYGGVRFQMGERLVYDENDLKGICAYDQPWISVEGIEVHVLSVTEAKPLAKAASQWENFFDVAFVGYKYFDLLEDAFPKVLRQHGLLILETKLRSTEIKTHIADFEGNLMNFARDAKLEQAINYNALNSQNSILKFIKN